MKTFFYFLAGFCLLSASTSAQLQCNSILSAVTNTAISQPTTCIQFLNDFVPGSSDPTLEVNVSFYIAQGNNGSTWSTSSSVQAQYVLDLASSTFSNIQLPNLNIGANQVSDAKIKFKLSTYSVVLSANLYSNVAVEAVVTPWANADPNSICIFFGDDSSGGMTATHSYSTGEAPCLSPLLFGHV